MTYSEAKYEVKRLRAIPWRTKTKEEWNQLSEAYEAFGIEHNVIWCKHCKRSECPMFSGSPMTNCNFYTEEEEDEED